MNQKLLRIIYFGIMIIYCAKYIHSENPTNSRILQNRQRQEKQNRKQIVETNTIAKSQEMLKTQFYPKMPETQLNSMSTENDRFWDKEKPKRFQEDARKDQIPYDSMDSTSSSDEVLRKPKFITVAVDSDEFRRLKALRIKQKRKYKKHHHTLLLNDQAATKRSNRIDRNASLEPHIRDGKSGRMRTSEVPYRQPAKRHSNEYNADSQMPDRPVAVTTTPIPFVASSKSHVSFDDVTIRNSKLMPSGWSRTVMNLKNKRYSTAASRRLQMEMPPANNGTISGQSNAVSDRFKKKPIVRNRAPKFTPTPPRLTEDPSKDLKRELTTVPNFKWDSNVRGSDSNSEEKEESNVPSKSPDVAEAVENTPGQTDPSASDLETETTPSHVQNERQFLTPPSIKQGKEMGSQVVTTIPRGFLESTSISGRLKNSVLPPLASIEDDHAPDSEPDPPNNNNMDHEETTETLPPINHAISASVEDFLTFSAPSTVNPRNPYGNYMEMAMAAATGMPLEKFYPESTSSPAKQQSKTTKKLPSHPKQQKTQKSTSKSTLKPKSIFSTMEYFTDDDLKLNLVSKEVPETTSIGPLTSTKLTKLPKTKKKRVSTTKKSKHKVSTEKPKDTDDIILSFGLGSIFRSVLDAAKKYITITGKSDTGEPEMSDSGDTKSAYLSSYNSQQSVKRTPPDKLFPNGNRSRSKRRSHSPRKPTFSNESS